MRLARLTLSLVLLAGSATAQSLTDSNFVDIDQIGADNSADIVQGGQRNTLGLAINPFLQDGFFNDLNALQTGAGNSVGTPTSTLLQQGRFTTATVFNRIVLEQSSDGNLIASIEQRSLGAVPNGANVMTLEQSGGDGNRIDAAVQIQRGGQAPNEMTLRQTGPGNRIVLASQTASTTVRDEPNQMLVILAGARNGLAELRGVAALPGLTDSGLVQRVGLIDPRGNGNFIEMTVLGDDNAFGILQSGRMNSVGLVDILGNLNDVGLRQDGDENDIFLDQILGNGNIVGVSQLGTNLAEVGVVNFSDDNVVRVNQTGTNDGFVRVAGDGNIADLEQDFDDGRGGGNIADILVTGDANFAELRQRGTNTATFTIQGDGNNTANALSPRGVAAGLATGVIRQTGSDNGFTGSVTGDRNVIAALQGGDLNAILLEVTGDDNEAAFLQSGGGNTAALIQRGQGNRAMIRQ